MSMCNRPTVIPFPLWGIYYIMADEKLIKTIDAYSILSQGLHVKSNHTVFTWIIQMWLKPINT